MLCDANPSYLSDPESRTNNNIIASFCCVAICNESVIASFFLRGDLLLSL